MPELPPCRSCGASELHLFLSLGDVPLADNLLRPEALQELEPRFPLDVAFCPRCCLVQILEEVPPQQLFVDNYLYFSSFSDHLLDHSRRHAERLVEDRGLGPDSLVVELASNDGYLLRNFRNRGVRVLGVDPAPAQAQAANDAGIPTVAEFFGTDLAKRLRDEHGPADVVIANNVMAHVPELNDFVGGIAALVADDALVTVENPYVRDLIIHGEFDTIYHEHFSYYSCTSVDTLVRRHGLYLNDVEYFPDLHGGTLRWHIAAREDVTPRASGYLEDERAIGLTTPAYYDDFSRRVGGIRTELLDLLRGLRRDGARIAAYGAAAKGTTMLNYVGIDGDLVDFVVDRNTHKHGLLMPGVHLPVRPVEALLEEQPDFVLILAWNFANEIVRQQQAYVERGGRFILPVPHPRVIG